MSEYDQEPIKLFTAEVLNLEGNFIYFVGPSGSGKTRRMILEASKRYRAKKPRKIIILDRHCSIGSGLLGALDHQGTGIRSGNLVHIASHRGITSFFEQFQAAYGKRRNHLDLEANPKLFCDHLGIIPLEDVMLLVDNGDGIDSLLANPMGRTQCGLFPSFSKALTLSTVQTKRP